MSTAVVLEAGRDRPEAIARESLPKQIGVIACEHSRRGFERVRDREAIE